MVILEEISVNFCPRSPRLSQELTNAHLPNRERRFDYDTSRQLRLAGDAIMKGNWNLGDVRVLSQRTKARFDLK